MVFQTNTILFSLKPDFVRKAGGFVNNLKDFSGDYIWMVWWLQCLPFSLESVFKRERSIEYTLLAVLGHNPPMYTFAKHADIVLISPQKEIDLSTPRLPISEQ